MEKEIKKWRNHFEKGTIQWTFFDLVLFGYKKEMTHGNMTISIKEHIDQYKSVECNPIDLFNCLYHTYHPVRAIIELGDISEYHKSKNLQS